MIFTTSTENVAESYSFENPVDDDRALSQHSRDVTAMIGTKDTTRSPVAASTGCTAPRASQMEPVAFEIGHGLTS